MTKDKEREAFEAWYNEECFFFPDWQNNPEKEALLKAYMKSSWQARAALDSSEELVEALEEIANSDDVHEEWYKTIAKEALAKHKQRKGE